VSNRRRRKNTARPGTRRPPVAGADFWGTTTPDDDLGRIPRSEDPAVLVDSLGPAPLPGRETIAEHYFATVYGKAAALATALAAAADLLETPEPDDEEHSRRY